MNHAPSPKLRGKLWLIGGTSESIHLVHQLRAQAETVLVTVTTAAARQRFSAYPTLGVESICFESDHQLQEWIGRHQILGILDASHPFAVEISTRAMRVAEQLNLPYLRFERSPVSTPASDWVQEVALGDEILPLQDLAGHRILLTLGSRSLSQFSSWHQHCELFARILPTETAVRLALKAGFPRAHLIAMQPPLSLALECALWKHWRISRVITKASGEAGGEDIKRQAAAQLHIPLIILQRPEVSYRWKTASLSTALRFSQQVTRPLPQD
ncbi:cobalt-precorrin-6A reductase [Lyngbya confervoides]|uniref:Cobalt-precorrin-6A reductase n=1 Tax=Lyngbya confervoides BDU141951 TaxID=1574623 RepID=A0ABD4T4P4_9CYAN|nr:cobalt-precorrin-6A reductase [Lyngbya confervoides]MCM1983564.1 cobalt-precorrin-6A reductase [Lyngbya confervoides BDU141951]